MSRKILVVDDEPLIRKLFAKALRAEGTEVDQAADGLEAVEMATQEQYDVILTDIRMPRMDGLEAARSIREHQRRENLPESYFIVISGYTRGIRAEVDEISDIVIDKPVNVNVVREAVDSFYQQA